MVEDYHGQDEALEVVAQPKCHRICALCSLSMLGSALTQKHSIQRLLSMQTSEGLNIRITIRINDQKTRTLHCVKCEGYRSKMNAWEEGQDRVPL